MVTQGKSWSLGSTQISFAPRYAGTSPTSLPSWLGASLVFSMGYGQFPRSETRPEDATCRSLQPELMNPTLCIDPRARILHCSYTLSQAASDVFAYEYASRTAVLCNNHALAGSSPKL